RIYGLTGTLNGTAGDPITPSLPDTITCPASIDPAAAVSGTTRIHQLYGTVCQASKSELKLVLNSGRAVSIDTTTMLNERRPVLLTPGRPVLVNFTIDKA